MEKARDKFMVAVQMEFWLHIDANDQKQAEQIASAVYKSIKNNVEKERDNAQGEMLSGRRSGAYPCTREEAWRNCERDDQERDYPHDEDNGFDAYTRALQVKESV